MILVVDECVDISAMIADILADEGYTVRCIKRITPETIRLAQAHLVILDLDEGSPDTTMLLLGQLRHDNTTRDLPILVSSTDPRLLSELAEPLRYLKCGTLLKPFDIDQLLTYVAHNIKAAAGN